MKRVAGIMCALAVAACAHKPPPAPKVEAAAPAAPKRVETPMFWRADGQAALAALQKPAIKGTRAKNLILFVGDGMGISTVTAARILQGQSSDPPANGEENVLAFERFPASALVKPYNFDLQTPESAGSMTAIMSGVKTRGTSVGLDQIPLRGQCAEAFGHETPTLLEEAKDAGLAVGLVSTVRVTHAVPAATYAHVSDRDWETDTRIPAELKPQGCADIARQLVDFDHHGPMDVVLGGGRLAFMASGDHDPQDSNRFGVRADRNLISAWLARYPNGRYVWTGSQLKGVDWTSVTGPVLGLFTPDHMSYFADRKQAAGDEPGLTDMTAAAIKGLSRNKKGYVLVVDAGGIDRAHHEGDAARALTDTIELSNAVAKAVELTQESDTLIVVTADNSHTMTIGGYPKRGDPILGYAHDQTGAPLLDARGKPYTTLTYANGPGYREGAAPPPPAPSDPKAFDYLQQAAVPMSAETHGGEDVPIYARGPGSQWVHGVVEQHTLYWIMQAALDGLHPLPPVKKKLLAIPKVPALPKLPALPKFGGK